MILMLTMMLFAADAFLDIHNYLIKKWLYNKMFRFVKIILISTMMLWTIKNVK